MPDMPMPYTNDYIIRSEKRNLIIDTGLKHDASRKAMATVLQKLRVDVSVMDFVLTHAHQDHFGLLPYLVMETSVVYTSEKEIEYL